VAVPPPQPPQQRHPFWGAAFDNEPRARVAARLGILFVPVVQGEAG
jgi:alkanesulfonate monooxygenase SsuD/methylene tetrahydromethanopterin reductase-like flavin-dependent oxidoreductase (luciferase family)